MRHKIITAFCVFSLFLATFAPNLVEAQYNIPGLPTSPTDTVPPVPVSDSAIRTKEVGLTLFGYTIPGLSWDSITIGIAKKTIERIVDSTTDWINSGFEGSPAYVTNPERYFANIADGIAGDFIAGSDLGFLCSPFQQQIRISLKNNYYKPTRSQFQCTWTGVRGNLEDFYNDFSAGGWDGWFQMTQNPTNNPYDAYIAAEIELNGQISRALGLKTQEYQANAGFLSTRDCIRRNGTPPAEDPDFDEGYFDPSYNPAFAPGACLDYGPVKTPGKVIESQLEKVMGTGIAQLELADSFDQLINALLGQLLNRTVFAAQGLFTNKSSDNRVSGSTTNVGGGSQNATPQVSCFARSQSATAGEDRVTWGLQSALEVGTTYSWGGDEMPTASTTSVTLVYQTPGTKTATVTARPPASSNNPNPQPIPVTCQNSVLVSRYRPLTVSCSPASYTTRSGEPVRWNAFVSGGSGNLRDVVWGGSENFAPKTHTSVWPQFDPSAALVVHRYVDNDLRPRTSTLQTIKNATTTQLVLTRIYMDGDGPRDLSVTVVDNDSTVPAVVDKRCDGTIYVSG